MLPLVTCIMPTANRREFVRRSVALFLAQDCDGVAKKQLLIVEDGSEQNSDLAKISDQIQYAYLGEDRRTIGEKRNLACRWATGDLIMHWDDDDWHSPQRISTQVAALAAGHALGAAGHAAGQGARICGLGRLVIYSDEEDAAWLYQSVRWPWLAGGTLLYERSLWQQMGGFTHRSSGEDTLFVDEAVRRGEPIVTLQDESLYVAMLHGGNTETRERDPQWGEYDAMKVRRWFDSTRRAA